MFQTIVIANREPPKAAEFVSFPFRGKAGMGVGVALYASAPPLKPIPTLTLWRNY
jgi:hypothetical protein